MLVAVSRVHLKPPTVACVRIAMLDEIMFFLNGEGVTFLNYVFQSYKKSIQNYIQGIHDVCRAPLQGDDAGVRESLKERTMKISDISTSVVGNSTFLCFLRLGYIIAYWCLAVVM